MKKMISAALLASFMAYSPVAFAATSQEEGKAEASKESKQLVLNSFKDNWMISIEGGANFNLGPDDSHAKFGERIAPVFGLNVEKWFSPVIGLRLGVDYYGFKGATSDPLAHGVSTEMIKEGYFKQSFESIYPSLDVMGDLSSLFCGYRDRVYSPILYVGLGVPVAISGDGNIADFQNMGMRGGLLNRFRVAEAWAINLDIRFDVFENRYASEIGHGKQLSALVGVTYKFKGRGWNAPYVKYPEAVGDALVAKVSDLEKANADLNEQLANSKRELADRNETIANLTKENKDLNDALQNCDKNHYVTVYFGIGSSKLTSKDRKVLKAVAEAMKATDKEYAIVGYADAGTGTAERNAELRMERAKSVEAALVSYGVPESRLHPEACNETLGLGAEELDRVARIAFTKKKLSYDNK